MRLMTLPFGSSGSGSATIFSPFALRWTSFLNSVS